MKFSGLIFTGISALSTAQPDLFNYRGTDGRDYGPEDWDEVSCNNLATCPGWPAKLIGSQGWKPQTNECAWCPATGNNCGQHRQSPIDLRRNRAIFDNPKWKECPDWHWIQYLDGTCDWEDMDGQFEIGRNALMIHTPLRPNGDIDCVNAAGERKFPKLDYSKGFPDWWYLSRTDISTPSEHTQQGKRYAAEVKLSHFYEIDHYKNKLGVISIFMQDFENEPSWPYLDKLICKWRREEEEKRVACGLPPAPVYKMCELYRGQVRSEDDFDAPVAAPNMPPTFPPLVPPPAQPIVNFGGDPEEFRLPLGLCEGDCDFSTDCAPGLICHRRDAFESAPGCIGGETDPTNTDYCVFDPFGGGYTLPTETPTSFPTFTERPTLTPLEPKNLTDYGGTPDSENFPLQYCEGDCDRDEDCAEGLICFQRGEFEAIPGCLGGELYGNKTDFCILDPYGVGYVDESPTTSPTTKPTKRPTTSPTVATSSPTLPVTQSPTLPGTQSPTLPVTQSPTLPVTPAPTDGPSPQPSTLVPTQVPSTIEPMPSPYPTYFPRPVGEPLQLQNLGWEPPTPLGECQGDCDEDADCGPGLYCYQRNFAFQIVPGCAGGDLDSSLTDYCAFRPIPEDPSVVDTRVDTTAPTDEITSSPTTKPTIGSPASDPLDAPVTTDSSVGTPVATNSPTDAPIATASPTEAPVATNSPTEAPVATGNPTEAPVATNSPTEAPVSTGSPTEAPVSTGSPTEAPVSTGSPTEAPVSTGGPTVSPISSPTDAPIATQGPTQMELIQEFKNVTIVGWSPNELLGLCEGDCDNNLDCQEGLICYQRDRQNAEVPGCLNGALDGTLTDYCINPNAVNRPPALPTESPTGSPTKAPVSLAPVAPLPRLNNLGWTPPFENMPLGNCEGDCDIDDDCGPGLVCFQRFFPNLAAPGCSGGESDFTLTDYCIREELVSNIQITEAPVSATTAAPVAPIAAPIAPTAAPVAPTAAPVTQSPTTAPVTPTAAPVTPTAAPVTPTAAPVTPTTAPVAPTTAPIAPTQAPVALTPAPVTPTTAPVETVVDTPSPTDDVPPAITCSDYDVNYNRMCRENSCCVEPRSNSQFCHESYVALGDAVESACHHCCQEQNGSTRNVGPAPEVNPNIPQLLSCDQVNTSDRICRPNSCCDESGKNTDFCQEQYKEYSEEEIDSICWYCCHPSKEVDFDLRRVLTEVSEPAPKKKERQTTILKRSKIALKQYYKNFTHPVGEKDRVTHDVNGREIIVRKENFEEKGMMDEEAYFEQMFSAFKRRALQESLVENYDDVDWWPYEWFLKVGTEYYFRYEGTQTVPPCYDTAHWRVFKDPIRVAPHQMRELERLIAWRRGDNCEVDTAGKSTESQDRVDVARPVQQYNKLHRKVFCECQDWPSKFPADRQWCRNWQNNPPEERLFYRPYNWPSDGFNFLEDQIPV